MPLIFILVGWCWWVHLSKCTPFINKTLIVGYLDAPGRITWHCLPSPGLTAQCNWIRNTFTQPPMLTKSVPFRWFLGSPVNRLNPSQNIYHSQIKQTTKRPSTKWSWNCFQLMITSSWYNWKILNTQHLLKKYRARKQRIDSEERDRAGRSWEKEQTKRKACDKLKDRSCKTGDNLFFTSKKVFCLVCRLDHEMWGALTMYALNAKYIRDCLWNVL